MPAVFKAVLPGKIKVTAFRQEMEDEMGEFGEVVLKDFEKTVRTWKNKPDFETIREVKDAGVEMLIGTDSEIFKFVDKGTKPHVIRPKTKKVLRFKSAYTAKTTPNLLSSKKGGAKGKFIFAKKVNHPGTKARNFTKMIVANRGKEFPGRMRNALNKAAKKSGHSI